VGLDAEDLLRRLNLAIKRINELEDAHSSLEFLSTAFLGAMNDIGRYGHEKYGQLPRLRCDHADPARVTSAVIAEHAREHFEEYLYDIPHDHFNTKRHQLAAVAFNAMMEYYFAGLDDEA